MVRVDAELSACDIVSLFIIVLVDKILEKAYRQRQVRSFSIRCFMVSSLHPGLQHHFFDCLILFSITGLRNILMPVCVRLGDIIQTLERFEEIAILIRSHDSRRRREMLLRSRNMHLHSRCSFPRHKSSLSETKKLLLVQVTCSSPLMSMALVQVCIKSLLLLLESAALISFVSCLMFFTCTPVHCVDCIDCSGVFMGTRI